MKKALILHLLNSSYTEVLIQKTWKARGSNTEAVFTLIMRDSRKPDETSVNYIAESVSQPDVMHQLNNKYGDGIWSQIQRQDMLRLATKITTKWAVF